jgi:hypothetical protein
MEEQKPLAEAHESICLKPLSAPPGKHRMSAGALPGWSDLGEARVLAEPSRDPPCQPGRATEHDAAVG